MADTNTALLQLLMMGDGLHPSDWGVQNNANLQKLESAAAGATTLTLSGGSYTLTDDDARSSILVLNGILTGDQTLVLPARARQWLIVNNTTVHNVILHAAGSTGTDYTSAPASGPQGVFSDGTNIKPTIPQAQSEAGFVKIFAGATLPTNYLWCDGRAVSRTTYSNLFTAIGIAYGAGDGTTTFQVPDFRGRVPMGADNLGGTAANRITSIANALGTVGGEEKHALIVAELASHGHSVTDNGHGHGVTDNGHAHSFSYTSPDSLLMVQGTQFPVTVSATTKSAGGTTSSATTGISINGATTGISINNTGSGTAHNNLQPLNTVNFVIHI